MSAGKFDGLSHNELYAMVADASPSQLTEMGSALSEASMELNAISDLLRHHVERVEWEGEGGDAFREWGGETAKQAAKLADYAVFAGTVVGEERGLMNRGPAGMGTHAGAVGGSIPSSQGVGPARRLASEPGGVAGRPSGAGNSQAPAAGSLRPQRGERADFTPGGSGLVRENQPPCVRPLGGAAAQDGRRRRAVSRPDYLAEDEETWTGGRRDTVPPVIQ